MPDYLHDCLALAETIRTRYYPQVADFESLERLGRRIRSGRRLTYRDAEDILRPNNQFWVMPARPEFEEKIEGVELDLWNLPRKEETVVTRLLKIFRQIGPVSVLLRFLHPESYGIFSAPVVEILETRRELAFKGALESISRQYVNYLSDLRGLRESRDFKRVADVETALWALYEGVLRRGISGTERLERSFREDSELRRIRVRNLVDDLLSQSTQRDLAQALLEVDPLRSAQFAGLEFELRLRNFAQQADSGGNNAEDGLFEVIERLAEKGIIDSIKAGRWHKARKTRNQAAHGNTPPHIDIRLLLDAVDDLDPRDDRK